jgi:acyl-CoA synthetase (AMP-forming)/AMP-acid ligase II
VTDSAHALLREAAQRGPERPVFIAGGAVTTYADLDRRSSRLAHALSELGIERGDRVAMLLDGDADYLVVYYGVAKAGAVVVPLCPDTRTRTLTAALSDAEARAVVLDARNTRFLSGTLAQLPALSLVISRGPSQLAPEGECRIVDFAELLAHGTELHDTGRREGDLLAICYTSGTTGAPKGVMLSHRNLCANAASIAAYLELGPDDRVGMVLPYYYAYGNSVLHSHVRAGGAIVQLGSLAFPPRVLAGLSAQGCTGFSGVPSTFARLLESSELARHDFAALRYITQAGAAMTPALGLQLERAFPKARVFVMYGQTEATARLSYVPPEKLAEKRGSVGVAIPGVTLQIVDTGGRPLPCGEVGEVVATGDNVMLGYFRRPEETAEVLRPYGLRTGDLGRMDADGYLYLVGRDSEMIKAGAHRIGPREIETVIAEVPGVRECAVFGVADAFLGQAIAAFVVASAGSTLDKQTLTRACLEQLPRFKVPEHFRLVSELPRSDAGKVRSRDLAAAYERGEGETL